MKLESFEELLKRGSAAAERNAASRAPAPCADGCGTLVPGPARICDACSSRQARNERADRSLRSVPNRFRWSHFRAPELEQRVERKNAIHEGRSARDAHHVVLIGLSGCGKTSLSVAMLRARVEAVPERSAMFLSALRLGIARARSEDSEPQLVAQASRVDLLLLDDLGNETDVASSPIKDVVWRRHDDHRATWVTTGLKLEAIAVRYGDGLARRLFEHAMVIDCEDLKP